MTAQLEYQETFVVFVDFLGFSEANRELDDAKRLQVLQLLQALVEMRSDFAAAAQPHSSGGTTWQSPRL
jgi:hypothetical protein